ncbi:MAG: UDP-N-acetylmuramoyl-L-alanine--D-glutamate ligase [Planctomycetes bacterium]|nr:UDP-N-acetylmuramoyl-L-alanine--D-glutamate ligase [Planctomycetota bacterium]MCC7168899.1 UDP-N-acetylmuramoyl-L-alanine--D-glutamate ligase [Planctomycetota bacterium]
MNAPFSYSFPTDTALRGKRVTVMGLGLFGGGAAVVRFLASRGCEVVVTDLRDERALAPTLAELEGIAFTRVFGEHRTSDFTATDFVVVNPAVPETSPFVRAAIDAGVPLLSEIGLFVARCRARLAFVTGSKGKSTTTSLLYAMARAAGVDAILGGNIGQPLLHRVDAITADQLVAFEISSFQLDQLRGLTRSVEVAVVTNLYEVHIERHGTLEAYAAAKRTVLEGAKTAVLRFDDARVRAFADDFRGDVRWFAKGERPPRGLWLDGDVLRDERGTQVAARREFILPGRHNLLNVAAAVLAAEVLGIDRAVALEAARAFRGVEHRLELVGEFDGVRYYNDSIATTNEAAMAALEAIEGGLVLLAGGKEATRDLAPLAAAIAKRVKTLITFGEAGPRLARGVRELGLRTPVVEVSDLVAAMDHARSCVARGDAVLLSPAFPSYDQFTNFRERGERFKALASRSGLSG